MNMMSFNIIGPSVERAVGTLVVLGMAIIFPLAIGVTYLLMQYFAAAVMKDESYLYSCAVGFSGVLFGLVMVDTGVAWGRGERTRRLLSCTVPSWLYPLAVLVGLSLLMPGISFVGHLAGVAVGTMYVKGLLLPFSLPRTWVLWVQQALVPSFVSSLSSWCAVPAEDPLESLRPECLRGPGPPRWTCPTPPNVEGLSAAHAIVLCCQGLATVFRARRRAANGGAPGAAAGAAGAAGQAAGNGNGNGARSAIAMQRANALNPPRGPVVAAGGGAANAAAGAAGAAVGDGGVGGVGGGPASPSRSSPLLGPQARSLPSLPASFAPPAHALAAAPPASASASADEGFDGSALLHNGSSGGSGGEYSRLLPSNMDDEERGSSEGGSQRIMGPPNMGRGMPPRAVSLSPSAPLLHPGEQDSSDLEMQPVRSRALEEL